jgi:hypothetical protein
MELQSNEPELRKTSSRLRVHHGRSSEGNRYEMARTIDDVLARRYGYYS